MNQFLREYYVDDRNDYYNIVSMIAPRGKFNINRKQYDYFMREFSSQKSGIAEVPRLHIPLYFDFDIKKDAIENGEVHFYTEEQVKSIISIITTLTKKHFDVKDKDLFCCLLEKDIYQKSNGKFSNGFHLHFPSVFVSRDIFRTFMLPILEAKIKQETGFIIDDVYNHPWLLYGNVKDDKLQPYILTKVFNVSLNQMTVFDAFKNYKIFDEEEKQIQINDSNVDSLLPRIFSINVFGRNVNELVNNFDVDIPKKIVNVKPKIEDNRPLSEKAEEVKKFLPLILDNETHQNWYTIGQAIYNILEGQDEGLQLFIDWSRSASNFEESSCENLWKNMRFSNSGMGTLIYQAKLDSKSEYDEIVSVKPKLVFIEEEEKEEIDNDYCWTDFDNDRKETFNSYDELMLWFKKMFPLVCNKINIGKGCYLKNEYCDLKYNPVACYDLNKSIKFYYNSITKKGDKTISNKITVTLDTLFEESKLKTYSRVTCKPNNNIGKYDFNVWEKFKADVKIEYDIDKLKPLFDYIFEIICDSQEILYKYIISWLRYICKNPQTKTGKVLVFQSDKQRAGKGTFINWLMFHVFGKTSSYGTSLTKLTQKFNSFLINKSLIVVDELPTTSAKFHNTFDILKSLITEPYLDIEYKGKESIQTDNLCNFIFSTNNEKSIKIEKCDGRYVIFKINESKVGDIEFWNHVHTNVFTEDMGIHFFNYLINIDKDDDILVSIHQIPETELKNKMKEMSMNSMEIFIKLLKERDIDDFRITDLLNDDIIKEKDNYDNEFVLLNKIDINISLKFKKQSLYNHYINWCVKTGETQMKQKYLNTILTELRKSEYRYYEI